MNKNADYMVLEKYLLYINYHNLYLSKLINFTKFKIYKIQEIFFLEFREIGNFFVKLNNFFVNFF
jgi:hypothetical protein